MSLFNTIARLSDSIWTRKFFEDMNAERMRKRKDNKTDADGKGQEYTENMGLFSPHFGAQYWIGILLVLAGIAHSVYGYKKAKIAERCAKREAKRKEMCGDKDE